MCAADGASSDADMVASAASAAAPTTEEHPLARAPCGDVRVFTNLVRAQQKADDNVTHWLNRTDARTATHCAQLFQGFAAAHARRVAAIRRCLAETKAAVDDLAVRADAPGADPSLRSHLTAERAKVRSRRAGERGALTVARPSCPLPPTLRARSPCRGQVRHLSTELAAEDIVAEQTVVKFQDRCGALGLTFALPPPPAPTS